MKKPVDKSYKKNIAKVSKDGLKDFLPFILAEAVPDVTAGRAICMGITFDDGKPVGAVSSHAYSVVDVKTEENLVDGKIVKNRFVILANPWASEKIRRYDDKGNMYTNTTLKGEKAKGIFKMELSDFVSTYGSYTIT